MKLTRKMLKRWLRSVDACEDRYEVLREVRKAGSVKKLFKQLCRTSSESSVSAEWLAFLHGELWPNSPCRSGAINAVKSRGWRRVKRKILRQLR